jgi:uncharacterized protein DUF4331
MTSTRVLGSAVALVAAIGTCMALANRPVRAYQDSQATINKPSSDITDVYLFPSPTNSNNIVAVMDVFPLIPKGQGTSTFFDQSVLYQMKFDNQIGSAGHIPVENVVIQFSVGAGANGTQQIFVYGPASPNQTGTTNTLVNPSGSGLINKSFSADGGALTVFAGAREDPAFYDRNQLLRIIPDRNKGSTAQTCLPSGTNACPQGFNNPGADSQANANVLSFVVEMPKTLLEGSGNARKVAYWATTSSETGQ